MKVLVTGAGGFLGRVAVRELAARGHQVLAHVGPSGVALEPPPEASAWLWFAIEEASGFAEAMEGAEAVVHLAGPAAVAPSFERPFEYMRAHAAGTAALLEAVHGVRRFVYISSAEVYGCQNDAYVHERLIAAPRSPYAAAKLAAEELVGAVARAGGPHAIVLRPFSVYGAGQRRESLLSRILEQAHRGGTIELRDFRPVRDYVHVDDVASAIACACEHDFGEIATFNVGTGIGTSVVELAATVRELLGAAMPIVELGAERGASEIFGLVAETTRARDELGFTPAVDLRAGLERMLRSPALR